MSLLELPLDVICRDGGTQVRASINDAVADNYADLMREGATEFPPPVVFSSGDTLYLASGFHRVEGARRIGRASMMVDVREGTRNDALWFGLGDNATHGLQLTRADKRHAVELALVAFPDKSGAEIGRQIGCTHQYVSEIKARLRTNLQATCSLREVVVGKDGKQYPAVRQTAETTHPLSEAVVTQLKAGTPVRAIADDLNVSTRTVAKIRRDAGLETRDRSSVAVQERRDRMRTLAAEGYTSRQIAGMVGLTEPGCRAWLRDNHIDVPADRVVGKTKRHDSNRIIDSMVMEAVNLTAGVELIDFSDLDRERIPDWIRSLLGAREHLSGLIRRLMKERQHHVEQGTYPQAV